MNDLKIIHSSNKDIWEIDANDTLTYTTVIYNLTGETLFNLDIEINKPKEILFVDGTCKLNGEDWELNGERIYVKEIKPRENIILNIDIIPNKNEFLDEIISYVKVEYDKKIESESTSYSNGNYNNPKTFFELNESHDARMSIISQGLITPVISKNVLISHDISKSSVKVGEYVDFKFIIKNQSSMIIENAILENTSNAKLDIDSKSIYINGVYYNKNLGKKEIYIGTINPKETLLVSFRGKFKKLNSLDAISNKGNLYFFYKNNSYRHLSKSCESNEVILDLFPNVTKSINLSKLIEIPQENPKAKQVLDIFNYDIKITSQNIVQKNPCQNKTLFLDGYILGRVTYSSDTEEDDYYDNKIYVLEYELPFKSDIITPTDFNEFFSIIPKIQFIDANLIQKDRVYINAILDIDIIEE